MNLEKELSNIKEFSSLGRFNTHSKLGIIVERDCDSTSISYMERVLIDGSLYAIYGKSEIARKPFGEFREIILWSHKVFDEISKFKQGELI